MNHSFGVGVSECVADLRCDANCCVDRQLPLPPDASSESFPCHIRHQVIHQRLYSTGVVKRQDVGMLQFRKETYLANESELAELGAQFGVQHFDRDLAIMSLVARHVHCSECSLSDLALDVVAPREGVTK